MYEINENDCQIIQFDGVYINDENDENDENVEMMNDLNEF